jgi:hypothetical protein
MAHANIRYVLLALAYVGAGVPLAANAQSTTTSAAAADTPPLIDPAAMSAMDKMSAALGALPFFSVKSEATTEVVLVNGQKIQFSAHVDMKVKRPNAFRISSEADTQTREMYYDGKTFTIFAPRLGYYASFDAPSTIGQTIDKARTQYALEIPLADLFIWGTDQTIRSRVKEAMVIRPERIGDRTCMHYAFRQEKADWQVWIDQGDKPLPCKLVITSTIDSSQPQYTSVLNWDLTTPIDPAGIAFAPPADAKKITIAEAAAEQGEGK